MEGRPSNSGRTVEAACPSTDETRACKLCQSIKPVGEFPKAAGNRAVHTCRPCFNQRHGRGRFMPPETRALQNLLTQCRKDNKRFFHKRMAIRHRELRESLQKRAESCSDPKQGFVELCKGRLVPLGISDPELTAGNCVVLDRASARVLVAAFRAAVGLHGAGEEKAAKVLAAGGDARGDAGLYREVVGSLGIEPASLA